MYIIAETGQNVGFRDGGILFVPHGTKRLPNEPAFERNRSFLHGEENKHEGI